MLLMLKVVLQVIKSVVVLRSSQDSLTLEKNKKICTHINLGLTFQSSLFVFAFLALNLCFTTSVATKLNG